MPHDWHVARVPAWGDPALEPVRRLYDRAFPDRERLSHDALREAIATGAATLLTVSDAADSPLAFAIYMVRDVTLDGEPRTLWWLWYLATEEAQRGQGIGETLYGDVARRAFDSGADALMLEVEAPELAETDADATLAARRIRFYQRQGARWLRSGYRYLQDSGKRPVRMALMLHPRPGLVLNAERAFRLLQAVLGASLQREELVLE